MFRATGLKNDAAVNGLHDSLNCYQVTSDFRFNDSTRGSQSPQPNTKNNANGQCDPAYPHWDRKRSDGDLGLIDQPQQMAEGKSTEQNTGNA
jgi:hypothetical protein